MSISTTVLGELYFAAHASGRVSANLQCVRLSVDDTYVWVFDDEAAREFGLIRAELRRKGKPYRPWTLRLPRSRRYAV